MEKYTYTSIDLLDLVCPKHLKPITGNMDDSFLFNLFLIKNYKWEDIKEKITQC